MADTRHHQPAEAFLPTRRSLLSRLKDWDDQASWKDFFDTYWKLIYGVAVKSGLSDAEGQDVVQETILSVAKQMPEFKYDPAIGSFKRWLLLITRRRVMDHLRKHYRQAEIRKPAPEAASGTDALEQIPDPAGFSLEAVWDEEWEKNLWAAALRKVKRQVDPRQFQIFDCYVLKQWPVKDVAKTFGIASGQVYLIKHRLSALLKQALKDLETKLV